MHKGDTTRAAILEHAVDLASQVGLAGLTIGRLSRDLELSKSGLFAHFQSKEALQAQVLEAAAYRFVETVVRPALTRPRGEPRVRALFDRWLSWVKSQGMRGGCIFVAAAAELDDRPGRVRDRLVELQREWLELIGNVVRTGIVNGQFRADLDPGQFAHDLYAVMLGYHHASRLLKDGRAEARASAAFEALLVAARRDFRLQRSPRDRQPRILQTKAGTRS